MKPSDPCEVSFPPSLRLGLQIERMLMTRPVPQWLLEIPRSHSRPTSLSPSGLRTLFHTPDTPTYPDENGPFPSFSPRRGEGLRLRGARLFALRPSHFVRFLTAP